MTAASCSAPLAEDELVSYWAGDLPAADVDRIDEHLMGCERCTAASRRIAELTEALRAFIPPIVTREGAAALRARGLRIVENPVLPDQRKPAVFPRDADILLHRMGNLSLAEADRVDVTVRVEETGALLMEQPAVPFDRDATEVMLTCQQHYAVFPPNVVITVQIHDRSGAQRVSHYPIPHVFEPASH